MSLGRGRGDISDSRILHCESVGSMPPGLHSHVIIHNLTVNMKIASNINATFLLLESAKKVHFLFHFSG